MRFGLVAEPWWVNLALLVPVGTYLVWRHYSIAISVRQLIIIGLFASAFGFLEATVVVYLRAAAGLLPGYYTTLSEVAGSVPQSQLLGKLPSGLLSLEVSREAATMLMLISAALLTPVKAKSRVAVFLWAFAIWDIIYYVSLWATIGWPHSIQDGDVLFLIPEPWFAPVWFPLLVSALTMLAVLLTRTSPPNSIQREVIRSSVDEQELS
jgi:hypothetical protein